MKKAVIIGGSNGIGLSIAAKLVSGGHHALILDKVAPEVDTLLKDGDYTYIPCNLLNKRRIKTIATKYLYCTQGLANAMLSA